MELTIDILISEAQAELGLSSDADTPIMRTWVYDAIRTIGTLRFSLIRGEWQLLNELDVKKPKGFIAPVCITISKDKSCCVYPTMDSLTAKCGCCMNCNCSCEVKVGETSNTFYFSSNAKEYKYVKLDYLCSPMDDNGMPIIEEEFARAVKQYISLMYKRMQRNVKKDIPMSEIQYEEDRWIRLMKAARGRKNMPRMQELKGIGEAWMHGGININDFLGRTCYW